MGLLWGMLKMSQKEQLLAKKTGLIAVLQTMVGISDRILADPCQDTSRLAPIWRRAFDVQIAFGHARTGWSANLVYDCNGMQCPSVTVAI